MVARDFDAMVEIYRQLGLEISSAPEDPGGTRHAAAQFQSGLSFEF